MEREDVKRTLKLIPFEEAQRQLLKAACIKPLGHEETPVEDSLGRVLAVDIISSLNIPGEDRAVFDGYAVRSIDTQNASLKNPVYLKIVGKAFPGEPPSQISHGQAIYTACGAILPRGADAIIKVENTRQLGEEIEIRSPVMPGENIGRVGEDVKAGELLFRKGHVLRPQDIGLLAGMGLNLVKVFRRPRIGIISVGDELIKLSEKHPLRMANNYALIISSLISEFGGVPRIFGIVPDDLNQIKLRISEALKESEIVATIAGCSLGTKDLVPDAINALGNPGLVFHGIRLSPGKVSGAGVIDGKPIVMLPGHIVSAYAAFYLFLAPLIAQYYGLNVESIFPTVRAKISQDVKAKPISTFMRVHLTHSKNGLIAEPIHGGSGVLTTLVKSNGYTIVPSGKELKRGTDIKVILFSRYEFGHILQSKGIQNISED